MIAPGVGSFVTRFATADIAERDRIPAWRDYWGRRIFGTDVEQATDDPFDGEVRIRTFPGIHLISSRLSPVRLIRSSALTTDGNDCLGLVTSSCGIGTAQEGRELSLARGEATFLSSSDPSILESGENGLLCCILVERRMLSPLARDPETAIQRAIPANHGLLRLLLGYLSIAVDDEAVFSADFSGVIASHVRDLIALMLEPDLDREAVGSGLRAVQLAHIKRYLADNCGDASLSIHHVASRTGLSVRYIQRLFARQGTTFTDYLLDRRLERVCRSLSAPSNADRTVASIALDAGFSDISHFNRCFKSKFGLSPRDYRAGQRKLT